MRRIRFWAIGLISFFSITAGSLLHRILAVSLCGVLGFNSTVCYLGDSSRVNAAEVLGRGEKEAIVAQGVDIFRNDGGSSGQPQTDIFRNSNDPPLRNSNDAIQDSGRDAADEINKQASFDPCSSPSHKRLLNENYPESVTDTLRRHNAILQRLNQSSVNYDEFSTTVKLPQNVSAEQLFKEMLRDINSVGRGDGARQFNNLTDFSDWPQPSLERQVGDIIRIKIGSGLANSAGPFFR